MPRGPRWPQSKGGPLAHAVRPSVVLKRRWPPRQCARGLGGRKAKKATAHAAGTSSAPKAMRPPRPCGGDLGGPKAKEAPSPMRRGPWWSQSEGGPLAYAAGASVITK